MTPEKTVEPGQKFFNQESFPKEAAQQAERVLAFTKEHGVKMVNLVFTDVHGVMHWTQKPITELPGILKEGAGFDGSSIPGFKAIQESDMLLVPDGQTTVIDPFCTGPAANIICNVREPMNSELFDLAPRTIALRAEAALKKSGIADTVYMGPEPEFFIFDDVRVDQGPNHGSYSVDSDEGSWNSGRMQEGGNQGFQTRPKSGYFPAAPHDKQWEMRREMMQTMIDMGIVIETGHHEVAAAQAEIDMRYAPLTKQADQVMAYKYVVRNVAQKHGKVATFMPKPLKGDNGSGMHVHQSLWKNGEPLFAGEGFAGLSPMAEQYIAGLIEHGPALAALCNPYPNSYRRLVPGFEAPVNLVASSRNRSAAIRIPTYSDNPKSKRVEFRMPDPTANPHIAFAAMLCAGMDGIERKREFTAAMRTEKDVFSMGPDELEKIAKAPGNLEAALDALEADHEFLTRNGVFSEAFLMKYIDMKRAEIADERRSPTPHDFVTTFDK